MRVPRAIHSASRGAPGLHRVRELPGAADRLADALPCRSSSRSRSHPARAAGLRRPSWSGGSSSLAPATSSASGSPHGRSGSVDVLDVGGPPPWQAGGGRRTEHVRHADEPEHVGHVAAPGPLHVVGVDRAAADRRQSCPRLSGPRSARRCAGRPRRRAPRRPRGSRRRSRDARPSPRGSSGPPTPPRSIGRAALGGRPALACSPTFTGRNSNASSVRCMRHAGSSNPAVIRVVTPALSATGTSRGLSRCTWLSTPPGVAISPWHGIGHVPGPITVRSTPSVMSGLPARPMPAMRPSLMPRSAFTMPSSGSTTIALPITASSSDSPAARSAGSCASAGSSRTPRRLVGRLGEVVLDADP